MKEDSLALYENMQKAYQENKALHERKLLSYELEIESISLKLSEKDKLVENLQKVIENKENLLSKYQTETSKRFPNRENRKFSSQKTECDIDLRQTLKKRNMTTPRREIDHFVVELEKEHSNSFETRKSSDRPIGIKQLSEIFERKGEKSTTDTTNDHRQVRNTKNNSTFVDQAIEIAHCKRIIRELSKEIRTKDRIIGRKSLEIAKREKIIADQHVRIQSKEQFITEQMLTNSKTSNGPEDYAHSMSQRIAKDEPTGVDALLKIETPLTSQIDSTQQIPPITTSMPTTPLTPMPLLPLPCFVSLAPHPTRFVDHEQPTRGPNATRDMLLTGRSAPQKAPRGETPKSQFRATAKASSDHLSFDEQTRATKMQMREILFQRLSVIMDQLTDRNRGKSIVTPTPKRTCESSDLSVAVVDGSTGQLTLRESQHTTENPIEHKRHQQQSRDVLRRHKQKLINEIKSFHFALQHRSSLEKDQYTRTSCRKETVGVKTTSALVNDICEWLSVCMMINGVEADGL
jgi:hypothetical protein